MTTHRRPNWLHRLLHRWQGPTVAAEPAEPHKGATADEGIGVIPAARTMDEIAMDGASDEERQAALDSDPYRQLVATHNAMNDIETDLRTGLDAVLERFMAAMESTALREAAVHLHASYKSWKQIDMLSEKPLSITPWTAGDWAKSRVGKNWNSMRANARRVLRETTMGLPVIELHEIYQEVAAR